MKKGRPSRAPKKLKDGYYISITLKDKVKPIRIMRETIAELKYAEEKFKNSNVQYLGQVENHVWIDGPRKGKQTP
jgi:hypothetical protein